MSNASFWLMIAEATSSIQPSKENTVSDKPLQQIAEIQIDGEKYDIAKNGGDFHIVRQRGPDAYGRPVAERVDLRLFLLNMESDIGRAQALLNLLGNALVSVRTQRDARLGVGEREES